MIKDQLDVANITSHDRKRKVKNKMGYTGKFSGHKTFLFAIKFKINGSSTSFKRKFNLSLVFNSSSIFNELGVFLAFSLRFH